MFFVRPVAAADQPALEALTAGVTPGVHTLARTRNTLERAVARSLESFGAQPEVPRDESYLFVLVADDGSLAGTAAIAATAGASGTFFCFRREVLHQVARDLNISHRVQALTLCSDLTNCSQLSGFFLPRREAGKQAALLSRARLLFAAAAPERFADKFFASMAGFTDASGRSPFWDALGRKFFGMDFLEAERMIEGARNRSLIVELMPPYPVYVPLLPREAQQAMGQVHAEGRLSCRLLEEEGFAPDQYLDIFDGGAILQAHGSALRAFADSTRRAVAELGARTDAEEPVFHLVSNARTEGFRAVATRCRAPAFSDKVGLDADAMRALDVVAGDTVLCVRL